MSNTKEMKFDIVPQELGLDKPSTASLETAFAGFFKDAEEWKGKAEIITDPKDARTARLELKSLRVSAEKKRKELKADSLRMGKAIDGANNILLAIIVPIEKGLESIEKAEERRLAEVLADMIACRTDKLRAFIDNDTPIPNVGAMTEDQFQIVLDDAKLLFDTKAEAVKKAAEETAKREAEEAAERVRVAKENEELKKEAAAAKAEQKKADDLANKERVAREKAEAEAQALRDERLMVATQLSKAKDDAEKAPDKEKLLALAESVRSLKNPSLTSKGGKEVSKLIGEQIEKFALWVEKESAKI
jgi:septal ring factor EnvC (AmiA/AmiB activator)